jgi:hypothetical protein
MLCLVAYVTLAGIPLSEPKQLDSRAAQVSRNHIEIVSTRAAMLIEHVHMRVAFLVIALAAGCSEKRNAAVCLDGHCPDPSKPFCDEGGEVGGEPGACVAVECTPGEFAACHDDRAVKCNNTGDNYDLVECMYGCSDASGCNDCNTAECETHIIPKYVPNECNQMSEREDLVISSMTMFNTEVECDSVLAQTDAPEICIIHRPSITIAANQTLRLYGTRVVALVADRELNVDGVLDIGAGGYIQNGPGGGVVISGGAVTGNLGSGGAGFMTAGGDGATINADGGGMNGGAAWPNPADMPTLVGGTKAANNNGFVLTTAAGGGATLISCRGTVSIPGLVDANGGGGAGGGMTMFDIPPIAIPASGGSSGGHVVLQGMSIHITGQLFANGGGGGGGQGPNGESGGYGQHGLRSVAPALGGPSLGAGGSGGYGGAPPTDGKKPTGALNFEGAGAGGGSAGFLQTYTPSGTSPMLTPTAVSPNFQQNRVVPTNR